MLTTAGYAVMGLVVFSYYTMLGAVTLWMRRSSRTPQLSEEEVDMEIEKALRKYCKRPGDSEKS